MPQELTLEYYEIYSSIRTKLLRIKTKNRFLIDLQKALEGEGLV